MLCFFLGWLGVVSLALADTASPPDSALASTKRIVRQYALTSANDFQQRDPQNWRLLASNDGGKSWVVLDVRNDEYFSERQQRRVFTLTNDTAYNMYRLEIDRVRDPSAADAVQLSEIELMGQSESDLSPTPLFCDAITAQGENPPDETADKAFDNNMATKWLDKAPQHPATRSSWIQWQYLNHAGLVITNISQLLSLRTSEGFPVRIACVSAGCVPGTNRLCVLDANGHIEIAVDEREAKITPGQRVLLSGVSVWDNSRVGIRQLQLQILEPKSPDKPKWIEAGQPFASDEDLQWVETEGQLNFFTWSGKYLESDLIENGHSISLRVLHPLPDQTLPQSGTRIRVSGICQSALNESGNCVAGILWVPSLDTASLAEQPNVTTNLSGDAGQQLSGAENEFPLTRIDQIRQLTSSELIYGPYVKVRGVVTELSGTCMQDETGGIELWPGNLTALKMPGLGSYVEVEGRAISSPRHGVQGYGPVILADKVRFLGYGKLPDPIRPSWSLLASGQMDAEWIEVQGVVRATDGSHLQLACEDGLLMATIVSADVLNVEDLVDARIRVKGVGIAATDERGQMQGVQLVVPSMKFIEVLQPPVNSSSLPVRNIVNSLQVRGSQDMIHRVKIRGVLTGFANNDYFVQDDTGSVMAIAKQDVTLSLPSGGWWSFWQSPKTNVSSYAATGLKVGDQVEVVGFPENHYYAPVLTEATVRKVGPPSRISAVKATASELTKGDLDSTLVTLEGQVLGSEAWETLYMLQIQSDQQVFEAFLPLKGENVPDIASGDHVRITGICQMYPVTPKELGRSPSTFSILLRSSSDISLLELPPWLTIKRVLLAAGTLIVILFGAFVWIRVLHGQVEARTLQLRQEIVEHEKTEGLLDRKTRLLQREIEEHEKTETTLAEKSNLLKKEIEKRESIYAELEEKKKSLESEIEERNSIQMEVEKIHRQLLTASRMAGMADVATNVLHNVGNVLNGVNVLAASIATHIQKSKVASVGRLADLLARHEIDLARFMTDDENGRHVSKYLKHLGDHLREDQSRLLDRVKSLTDNIQHVKEIVAMQQNYAKVSGVWETVAMAEVVEDSLKMCSESLVRHRIKVVRHYENAPLITLDRHKTLQILFNLIDNAKHACAALEEPAKQITIKINSPGDGRIQVEVADNGVGISSENLSHIFTQGFSTRKEGHGFGLHSSILAAQDMGGSLVVRSNGQGKGAAFILELPLIIRGINNSSIGNLPRC